MRRDPLNSPKGGGQREQQWPRKGGDVGDEGSSSPNSGHVHSFCLIPLGLNKHPPKRHRLHLLFLCMDALLSLLSNFSTF